MPGVFQSGMPRSTPRGRWGSGGGPEASTHPACVLGAWVEGHQAAQRKPPGSCHRLATCLGARDGGSCHRTCELQVSPPRLDGGWAGAAGGKAAEPPGARGWGRASGTPAVGPRRGAGARRGQEPRPQEARPCLAGVTPVSGAGPCDRQRADPHHRAGRTPHLAFLLF